MTPSGPATIFAISGPTASGKTALGVRLAKVVGGEVVNFDSVQIYSGIEIATAKPSEAEKQGIPHHLISYVDPNINYTAADWAADATAKIAEIEGRGAVPILVGGTGFYLRTLRNPLFESPKTDQGFAVVLRILLILKEFRIFTVCSHVSIPAAAEKLFANDSPRITRALEVIFQTGELFSKQQSNRVEPPELASRIRLFVLNPPREVLYEKINARTEQHFANGLVEEVQQLLAKGVNEDGNALGAHAYRRVCEYFRGERTLDLAIEKSKQDVRNYAKRQLTWYRREPGAIWLDAFGDDACILDKLLSKVY